MNGAGGRGERGRRRARPTAPRGRGTARAAARSPSQARSAGGSSPPGAATLQAPQRGRDTVRSSRPARRVSTIRSPPTDPATSGGRAPAAPRGRAPAAPRGRAPAAPRGRAPATRAPTAQRRAAMPDGAAATSATVPRSLSAAGALGLRKVLQRLALGRQDVSEASRLVNQLTPKLTEAIRRQGGIFSFIEQENAGSYYERVKVSEPNEFDIMFVIPVPLGVRLQLDQSDDTGAYYYLSLKRNPKEKYLSKYLDEDQKLSASKMLDELRDIIKREVSSIPDVTVKRKRPGSPAITLLITNPPSEISVDIILTLRVQQSWPSSTQDGLKIENWLGGKVKENYRKEPLYLVAKQNKKEKVLKGNTWRLSFSHLEKLMMNNHGNTKTCCESNGEKCCRKACLKLLKYLLERLKMKYPKKLEKICSYHIKTAFFHSCVTWPNDTSWPMGDLEQCFQRFLQKFLDFLQKSHLPHFFIPQYNLLGPEDKASSNFLSSQIHYELNNGFPIFQETS